MAEAEHQEFYKAYRQMLASLKRAGDIVNYKVWRDGDVIHAEIVPLPALDHIKIDKARYKEFIAELEQDVQRQVEQNDARNRQ